MTNLTTNQLFTKALELGRKTVAVLTLATLFLGSRGQVAQAAELAPGFTVRSNHAVTATADAFDGFTVPKAPAIATYKVDITAYTSSVEECDGNPFITADGSVVADGIVATNILPFGTKIRIPAYFGDKIFVVHDRMNARYSARVDIWMNDKGAMRQWGLKRNATIEVVERGDNKTNWDQWKNRTAELNRIGKEGPNALNA